MKQQIAVMEGNEAAAYIAFKTSEVCAIYPITPSSPMGEYADQWASQGKTNIWGATPHIAELQSEGGASGSIHGAAQTGALTSTFTASQGLLLMLPNMFKIAGELTPTVFHVSARTVATHALSIFGDHSDVMAARSTGFAMLASSSLQEIMDMALVSHVASLESRLPFLHFFDGFRSSHEVNKVEVIPEEIIREMIDDQLVVAHRQRGLSPSHPVIRGTAQNPDVFFQARETCNPFYAAAPGIVQKVMDRLAERTGRSYRLFDYFGAPDAERVIVLMGSGADTARETIEHLMADGEKIGMIQVHLFRPFSAEHLLQALPPSARVVGVLDRTKEPGAEGEPLYKDILTALGEAQQAGTLPGGAMPTVVGGRYGLSSKEFTPAMIKGVFEELRKERPKNRFTLGINDDVSNTHIDYDPSFMIESDKVVRALFYGLGSDGTVGANKNSIKIIGEETDFYAQGYFVYDSRKAGSKTASHLRFGPEPIRSRYLIQSANFIACHQFVFLEQIDMLQHAAPGAVFLLNAPFGVDEIWDKLPRRVQEQIIERRLKLYVIDAYRVARDTGMGQRINTIMQTCFFAISGVLPREEAIAKIKQAIQKTYGSKGDEIVRQNNAAVDETLSHLHEVKVPAQATSEIEMPPVVSAEAPAFVRDVVAEIMAERGDALPVSAFPVDGTFPTATTQWEKRNISLTVPVWDEAVCIQCGACSLVCPHGCIRAKRYDQKLLEDAPDGFKSIPPKGKGEEGRRHTLQVAVEDCTGCGLCIQVCPAKNKKEEGRKAINMEDKLPILEQERASFAFFLTLPDADRTALNLGMINQIQFARPLFEYSGACAGCGETPYVKLLSQLFGDRAVIANATGCSSIYGGNLPTTPWAVDAAGRGPAWSNSLFEDNAEFGYGFRLTFDQFAQTAREVLTRLRDDIGAEAADAILRAEQKDEAQIAAQRERVTSLKKRLETLDRPEARHLLSLADYLTHHSVWILGGDGWAYDIGYGGLDHVLASGRNVNVLVLDTEVYSNTGGQASKSTPRGAVAKFASAGKTQGKKDLALMAMSYGNVYVARVAVGSKPMQTIKAFREAEAYDGPSLILAYSHCIAHGIAMINGLEQQRLAVECGHWPLLRYHPDLSAEGKNPLQLDSKAPAIPFKQYAYNEVRYKMLVRSNPETAAKLLEEAQEDVRKRWAVYERMAAQN